MGKRSITIFKDLNDPYIQSLRDGMNESAEDRFIKFFEEKRKFQELMGLPKSGDRKITIRSAEWI